MLHETQLRLTQSVGMICNLCVWNRPDLDGAQGRNRTTDTRIFNPLLYRLSYLGIRVFKEGAVLNLLGLSKSTYINPKTSP